jgi:SAM-dependent methyltransferase
MRDPDSANRHAFSSARTVATYAQMAGLTPPEQYLFTEFLKSGMDILDLGVGGGRTTAALRSLGGDYVGIDYSEAMVKAAREQHPGADIREGDASDLSAFEDASFDAVIFAFNGIDYLHPREKRSRCFHECARVLKPGGVCILSSHNARFVLGRLHVRGRGLARVRTLAGSVFRAGILVATRLTRRTVWVGHGFAYDPAHGGLVGYEATPEHVVCGAMDAGLEPIQIVPSTYPKTPRSIAIPWYYYAFRRREATIRDGAGPAPSAP